MPQLSGMVKEAQEPAPGSGTAVQITVCFFTFLNSSFMLLQKEGVRKQHVSLNPPPLQKKRNNPQNFQWWDRVWKNASVLAFASGM